MQSSSSSHYVPSGGYDDLRLPPIRNTASHSSTSRAHATSKHVTTMEPPTFTSSSDHLRKGNVTLPSLSNLDPRPRTSIGHSSHTLASSLPFNPNLRHPSHSSHTSNPPQISPSYRPSSSHRSAASYDATPSAYPGYSQPYTNTHHTSGHHSSHDAHLQTLARAYSCDLCGATFSRAYDCKRHRDIHTRQGGHECPSCHKSLSRADALKRHMERGCSGAGNDDDDPEEIERDHQRDKKERKEKRHSASADTSSKYYYTSSTSSNTRYR